MKRFISALFIFCMILTQAAYAVEYTPIGAEAAGNATGEIPLWTGIKGLTCPEGWEQGDYLPSPYADEKPLFRIDHTNVDKYQDKLSPGQVARLKKAPHLYMDIYPSHRNFEMPEAYLAATQKNIKTTHLDENNIMQGYNGGVPFPFPKNGREAAWNTKRAWNGPDMISRDGCSRIVSPKGRVQKTTSIAKIIIMDENFRVEGEKISNPQKMAAMVLLYYTSPANQEGNAGLAVSFIDDDKKGQMWAYLPALRRVRRIPATDTGFQMGGENIDGEIGTGIAAPINDWNWKLLGKQEKYVPANNYEMWKIDATDKEELTTWGINPALMRYELRRVWVLEATPNEKTKNHPYGRKVAYLDEDTWNMTLDDRYDRRGNLWRMGETSQNYRYCDRYRHQASVIFVNLETGRYEVGGGCRTEESKMSVINIGLKPEEFTPQVLKKMGR